MLFWWLETWSNKEYSKHIGFNYHYQTSMIALQGLFIWNMIEERVFEPYRFHLSSTNTLQMVEFRQIRGKMKICLVLSKKTHILFPMLHHKSYQSHSKSRNLLLLISATFGLIISCNLTRIIHFYLAENKLLVWLHTRR